MPHFLVIRSKMSERSALRIASALPPDRCRVHLCYRLGIVFIRLVTRNVWRTELYSATRHQGSEADLVSAVAAFRASYKRANYPPLLILLPTKTPLFKRIKSLAKRKSTIIGPEGTRHQDWLCWRGPLAIWPTDYVQHGVGWVPCGFENKCKLFSGKPISSTTGAFP
jgi:hypothetical protein